MSTCQGYRDEPKNSSSWSTLVSIFLALLLIAFSVWQISIGSLPLLR